MYITRVVKRIRDMIRGYWVSVFFILDYLFNSTYITPTIFLQKVDIMTFIVTKFHLALIMFFSFIFTTCVIFCISLESRRRCTFMSLPLYLLSYDLLLRKYSITPCPYDISIKMYLYKKLRSEIVTFHS